MVTPQIQEDPLRHNLLQEFTATLQEGDRRYALARCYYGRGTPQVMTKCDRGIEEVREAGRVGAVAPFQQLVSDSRRTRCRLIQGFGKVHRDFFGGDGGEAPAVYRKGVVGVGRRDSFQDVGKNLSDRTCLISVVEVAREPSIFKSDGMRLARRP